MGSGANPGPAAAGLPAAGAGGFAALLAGPRTDGCMRRGRGVQLMSSGETGRRAAQTASSSASRGRAPRAPQRRGSALRPAVQARLATECYHAHVVPAPHPHGCNGTNIPSGIAYGGRSHGCAHPLHVYPLPSPHTSSTAASATSTETDSELVRPACGEYLHTSVGTRENAAAETAELSLRSHGVRATTAGCGQDARYHGYAPGGLWCRERSSEG